MSGRAGDADLDALLGYIRDTRGFDPTAFRRPVLASRIGDRILGLGIDRLRDYQDYLEANPLEFAGLFDAILVSGAAFFMDEKAWSHVALQIVPRILASKGANDPVRIWSAGCASGEEPYSLGMILVEALGEEAFEGRVKIYATDIDEVALAAGRAGTYSTSVTDNVPRETAERFLERDGDRATVDPLIRRAVVFGHHDLLQDTPMASIDLVSCRNVLLYFASELQTRILDRLHEALNDDGFLFLGRSEMIFSASRMFAPDSAPHRVFTKVIGPNPMRVLAAGSGEKDRGSPLRHLDELAVDASVAAQIVVDSEGIVVLANEQARRTFGLDRRDVGRALHDLEISYRPADLRSAIDEVRTEHRAYWFGGVERILADGVSQFFDLTVAPVVDESGADLGEIVTFTDVTDEMRLRAELENARRELEIAYEELHATNEEVQTSNEELQSTVEELDTTNQELQATNEELETMNEELQSTNEELRTVNEELRIRTDDLDQSTLLTDSIFGSLAIAMVAVDTEMAIRLWTTRATESWGLRAVEVMGTQFADLDCGLPVGDLVEPVRACMRRGEPVGPILLDTVDRVGRTARTRVRCLPTQVPGGTKGAVLVVEMLD